ncbi:MAG: hypothetical protein WBE06_11755, partial [Phycisphaerae bacterium]
TFNRSRSFRLIRSSILVLLPATRPERGQFYFAETGHYHFAATTPQKTLIPRLRPLRSSAQHLHRADG